MHQIGIRFKRLFLFIGYLGCLLLCGCENKPLLYEISADTESYRFPFYAQSQPLRLTANYRWSLAGYPAWIEPSLPEGGAGTHLITLRCAHNPSHTSSREGVLHIVCGDIRIPVNITQASASPLQVNIKDTTLFKNDLRLEVGVNSPIEYDILIPQYSDWIKVSALPEHFQSGKVIFSLTPPEEQKERKTIVIFAGKQADYIRDTLRITQSSREAAFQISSLPESLVFHHTGAGKKVKIKASHPWHTAPVPEWIRIDPPQGDPWIEECTLTCLPNTTNAPREHTLRLLCGDTGTSISIRQQSGQPIQVESESLYLPDSRSRFSISYQAESPFTLQIREGSTWLRVLHQDATEKGEIIFEASPRNVEQRTALVDLIYLDGSVAKTTLTVHQSRAYSINYELLKSLYDRLNGEKWHNNRNWLSLEHYTNWFGIKTAGEQITELTLPRNNLAGELPDAIGLFKNLKILDLSSNHLTGKLPDPILSLGNLNILNLSGNSMDFPFPWNIGNLSALTSLNFSGNTLGGTIPASLIQLTRLQELFLENCGMSGSIHSSQFEIESLTHLSLCNNNLSGSFHCSDKFLNLQTLNLSHNRLFCTLTPAFGLLPKLENLNLSYNLLIGCIPATLIKRFGKEYVLKHLAIQKNPDNPTATRLLPMNKFVPGDVIYEGDRPIAIVGYPYTASGEIISSEESGGEYALGVSLDFTELEWSLEEIETGASDPKEGRFNYQKYMEYTHLHPQAGSYPAFEWCTNYNQTHGSHWYIPAPEEVVNAYGHGKLWLTLRLLSPRDYYLNKLLTSHEAAPGNYTLVTCDFTNGNQCIRTQVPKTVKRYVRLVKHFRIN